MNPSRAICCFLLVLSARIARADPGAQKWATVPVTYKVFAHTSINGVTDFQSSALPAVRSGFARWTYPSVNCTRWTSTFGGLFSSPSGRAAINGSDGQNSVIWLGGSDWDQPSTVLGLTTTSYFVSSGQIFDSDMQLNNDRQWKVGGTDPGLIDVESIITHEAGHFFGLLHTASPYAIMYASYAIGAIKVDLTTDDINDVCGMYPSNQTGGTQGDLCAQDSNCAASGLFCRRVFQTSGSKICTGECTSDTNCRRGYTCQPSDPAGTTGYACLVPSGGPDLCRFCTGSSQCANGLCLRAGRNMLCSKTCQSQADCGSAFQCVSGGSSPDGGSRFCVPAGACPTPQCATAAECYPGFACVGGMCQATGNTGDRCEVSIYCAQCNICVGTPQQALCRACCGGQSLGGRCNTCSPVSCADGTCASLQSSTDRACITDGGSSSMGPGMTSGTDAARTGCGCAGGIPTSAGLATVMLLLLARASRRLK